MSEARFCPHCGVQLEPWVGPPETMWGEILVCNNNHCKFFRGSNETIAHKPDDSPLGCRYAEDPSNNFEPINLVAFRGC